MTADESTLLMGDYQSGVTAALIGILIALGVMSREEFAGALDRLEHARRWAPSRPVPAPDRQPSRATIAPSSSSRPRSSSDARHLLPLARLQGGDIQALPPDRPISLA
ncbi:hypothetical protein [Caulobacter zeae]|uniref:hypothetical protein n=1 Tax=Caulobacter zeae TaxID=2055137 RepID=UPI0010560E34|nr:hypothetical protein [Caulobacter zeae]